VAWRRPGASRRGGAPELVRLAEAWRSVAADTRARDAVDLALATASPSWLDRAATVRGLTLVGAFDAARARARAFVPSEEIDCEPVNDRTTRRARTELLIDAARVASRCGAHAEARASLAEARGVWEGGATPDPYQETPLRLARARGAAGERELALRALASFDADVPATFAGSDVPGWWVASLAEAFVEVGEAAVGLRLGRALARSLRTWTDSDPGVGRVLVALIASGAEGLEPLLEHLRKHALRSESPGRPGDKLFPVVSALARAGRRQDAETLLRDSRRADERSNQAALFDALLALGDLAAAEALYDALSRQSDDAPACARGLVGAYVDLARPADAARVFAAALRPPADASSLLALTPAALALAGRDPDGLEEVHRALSA